MVDESRLFLTRGRLFAFDNINGFSAEYAEGFEQLKAKAAFKALLAMHSVADCFIKLFESGETVVSSGSGVQLEFVDGDEELVKSKLIEDGLFFDEGLFAFYIINGKTLFILGHRVISDARSLAELAIDFLSFYKQRAASFEPVDAQIFSDVFSLPSNVFSPVIDRLASDLDVGWQKNPKGFTVSDYRLAREKYLSQRPAQGKFEKRLSEDRLIELLEFSEEASVDASSVVAYCFFKALDNKLAGKMRYKKMNIVSNGRIFFEASPQYRIAALDGVVTVNLKKKAKKNSSQLEVLKAFHSEAYKRLTSSFTVFYNDVLASKLSPSFCDSAYMFSAGLFKHKYSRKLAETYGCSDKVMAEFSSLNFRQSYWSGLEGFAKTEVYEPLKLRSSSFCSFVADKQGGCIAFSFNEKDIDRETAREIFDEAISGIAEFINKH